MEEFEAIMAARSEITPYLRLKVGQMFCFLGQFAKHGPP
jgi:hypothetical protein